jgi:hypothetical protein
MFSSPLAGVGVISVVSPGEGESEKTGAEVSSAGGACGSEGAQPEAKTSRMLSKIQTTLIIPPPFDGASVKSTTLFQDEFAPGMVPQISENLQGFH